MLNRFFLSIFVRPLSSGLRNKPFDLTVRTPEFTAARFPYSFQKFRIKLQDCCNWFAGVTGWLPPRQPIRRALAFK